MAEILAERVGLSKGTLSAIEKGEPTVSIGAYATILNALDMVNDFDYVAIDRENNVIKIRICIIESVQQREKKVVNEYDTNIIRAISALVRRWFRLHFIRFAF